MSNLENDLVDQPEEELDAEPREASADSLRVLEAVLFASDELLTTARLKTILPGTPDAREIGGMVEKINRQLQKERHPFEIVEIGGGYQFKTVAYYHPWVRQIFREKAAKRLSIQALECLSIVAYRQPLSKAEIEAIRGVLSDGAMKTLLEKRLITITGRSDKPGRPLLYGTTPEFLKYFGLNKISDLPRIEEFEAMVREKMESMEIDELKNVQDRALLDAAAGDEATIEISVPSEAPRPVQENADSGEAGVFEEALPAPAPEEGLFEATVEKQPEEEAQAQPAPAVHVMEAETVLQPAVSEERPAVTVRRKKKERIAKKESRHIEIKEPREAADAGEAVIEVATPADETGFAPETAAVRVEWTPPPAGPAAADSDDAVFEVRAAAVTDDAVFEVGAAAPEVETPQPEKGRDAAGDAIFEVKM